MSWWVRDFSKRLELYHLDAGCNIHVYKQESLPIGYHDNVC